MPGRQPPVRALITAEHASRRVPAAYRHLFAGAESVLSSHRAWDPGTGRLARELADKLELPLLEGQVTRLLVDLNRSAGHPRQFSEFSRRLDTDARQQLLERYWQPHWQAFRQAIESEPGRLIHIACHSFTPVLDGVTRRADIGLLYDPSRAPERDWCAALARRIADHLPNLKVRMNYPYRGTSNGLGQQHRRLYGPDRLLTMELEINSALLSSPEWRAIRQHLIAAVRTAFALAKSVDSLPSPLSECEQRKSFWTQRGEAAKKQKT